MSNHKELLSQLLMCYHDALVDVGGEVGDVIATDILNAIETLRKERTDADARHSSNSIQR